MLLTCLEIFSHLYITVFNIYFDIAKFEKSYCRKKTKTMWTLITIFFCVSILFAICVDSCTNKLRHVRDSHVVCFRFMTNLINSWNHVKTSKFHGNIFELSEALLFFSPLIPIIQLQQKLLLSTWNYSVVANWC